MPATESSAEDLLGLLLAPPYKHPRPNYRFGAQRGLPHLLEWLATHPGATWQERWEATGIEETAAGKWYLKILDWLESRRHSPVPNYVKADLTRALDLLLVSGTVRPSYKWMLTRQNTALLDLLARTRDPEGIAKLKAYGSQEHLDRSPRLNPLTRIAIILVAKGGTVADITVGDCRELWDIRHKRHSIARHHFYDLLRDAGFLPANAPDYLRMFLPEGQLGVEELIDRCGIENERVRQMLIDYLKERQPTLDYSTLVGVAYGLGKLFWRDIERHHPEVDSLHLPPPVVEAWKQRLMFKTKMTMVDGQLVEERKEERSGAKEKLHLVRALYLDIAHWAVEDARWATWAAPCPISPRDVNQVKDKKQRKSRMDQRTRERLPVLTRLVESVAEHRTRMAALLEAARAVEQGQSFTVAGKTWSRPVIRYGYAPKVWADDPETGKRLDLGQEEQQSFWAWAAVEILRHTGIRNEELLELSHHSFVQYRLPTTGELVPLLHIAPSKTDAERLLLISPDLADVLSAIVQRIRNSDGMVPLVVSYDSHERVWNPPMPLLFQRRYSNENRTFNSNYVSGLLDKAVARTGLTDITGSPLTFTPHDFRRLFITEAIMNGMPPHIAQAICGHADLNTTMGYKAIYPEEAILAHRAFIARRRRSRPSEEYRNITDEEWDEFLAHFEKRKVSLGNCGRAFASPCSHEHACVRCPMLQPDPAQRPRLEEIRDNLIARVAEAEREGWLGEVEGLKVSLAGAEEKLAHLDKRKHQGPVSLGLPAVAGTISDVRPHR